MKIGLRTVCNIVHDPPRGMKDDAQQSRSAMLGVSVSSAITSHPLSIVETLSSRVSMFNPRGNKVSRKSNKSVCTRNCKSKSVGVRTFFGDDDSRGWENGGRYGSYAFNKPKTPEDYAGGVMPESWI